MALRIFFFAIGTLTLLFAESEAQTDLSFSVESDLFTSLEEASAIATTSRLNIDEMPEFVTVLRRQELRALGVENLFDALSTIPGIQTSVMQNGIKKVVMRGYDTPNNFVFDKFKLIIDDHTVNTLNFQNSTYYLNFPIELIERIEVILGPAAALQASGALTGIIRVTTCTASDTAEKALFFRGGSHDETMAGFRERYEMDGVSLQLDAYYRKHDRMLDAEAFERHDTLSRKPESSEWLRDSSAGLSLRCGAFRLSGRIKREHHGNYFGWEEHLEISTKPGMTNRYEYLQALYETDPTSSESLRLQLDYNHYTFDALAQNYFDLSSDMRDLPLFMKISMSEASWQSEATLTTSRIENHSFRLGIAGSATRQYTDDFSIDIESVGYHHSSALTRKGLKRYLSSLFLTDAVAITDRLDGYIGLRYDYLSDMHKGYLSADATLLYRFDETWKFKAGYGHAYRAPSWVQLYTGFFPDLRIRAGNPDLEAEEADTVEGSIVFTPSTTHHLRLSLYYTLAENLIDNRESTALPTLPSYRGYLNSEDRESVGFELGYRYRPSILHDMTISCAYNDTAYETEGGASQSTPGVAHWNGSFTYLYNYDASTTLSGRIEYMGPREAHHDYGETEIPSYTTVDITYAHVSAKGWKGYATVKNLFDAEVRDSSYYSRHEKGIVRPGRTFFITIEYPL